MMRSLLLPTALVAALALTACSSDGSSGADATPTATATADAATDRAVAVVDFVASVVVPYQREAASTAAELEQAVVDLCAAPSADALDAARAAWSATDVARAAARMAGPGPTMDRTSVADIDWPTDATAVADLLGSDRDITVDTLASGSTSRRGLGAIEVLLFDGGSDALAEGGVAGRRCDYLTAAAAEVARATAEVLTLWIDGDDAHAPFADVLTGRSSVGRSTQGALDEIVGAQVAEVETLIGMWLGADATLEGPAGNGRAHLSAALGALEDTYDEMTALGPLLPTAQHESVRAAIRAAADAVQGTVGPLVALDESARTDLGAAVEAVEVVLRTDVVSALDVIVGFSDSDGDSG